MAPALALRKNAAARPVGCQLSAARGRKRRTAACHTRARCRGVVPGPGRHGRVERAAPGRDRRRAVARRLRPLGLDAPHVVVAEREADLKKSGPRETATRYEYYE